MQETEIAGNTIDRTTSALPDLIHEIGFAHEWTRHCQEISVSGSQNVVHHLCRSHAANKDYGDINRPLYCTRKRPIVSFRNRARKTTVQHSIGDGLQPANSDIGSDILAIGCHNSVGDFEAVETFRRELPSDGNAVGQGQATDDGVGNSEARGNGKVSAGRTAHRSVDLKDEARAPLRVTAPTIVATIGEGRNELRQKVAVAGVKMNTIESRARFARPAATAKSSSEEAIKLFGDFIGFDAMFFFK